MVMQEYSNLQRMVLNKHLTTFWVIFHPNQGKITGAEWDTFAIAI